MRAHFDRIHWESPVLSFHAVLGDLDKELWFKLPNGVERPDDDLIAGVFASLGGPDLDSIAMDLDVTPSIREAIEAFCGCALKAGVRHTGHDWLHGFDQHAVSFSGGFNSLAALALLPRNAGTCFDGLRWMVPTRDRFFYGVLATRC